MCGGPYGDQEVGPSGCRRRRGVSDGSAWLNIAPGTSRVSAHGARAAGVRQTWVDDFRRRAVPASMTCVRTSATTRHSPPNSSPADLRPAGTTHFASSFEMRARTYRARVAAYELDTSSRMVTFSRRSCACHVFNDAGLAELSDHAPLIVAFPRPESHGRQPMTRLIVQSGRPRSPPESAVGSPQAMPASGVLVTTLPRATAIPTTDSANELTAGPVGGHEILPVGGHETARWWPRELPTGGQQNCPR